MRIRATVRRQKTPFGYDMGKIVSKELADFIDKDVVLDLKVLEEKR